MLRCTGVLDPAGGMGRARRPTGHLVSRVQDSDGCSEVRGARLRQVGLTPPLESSALRRTG